MNPLDKAKLALRNYIKNNPEKVKNDLEQLRQLSNMDNEKKYHIKILFHLDVWHLTPFKFKSIVQEIKVYKYGFLFCTIVITK
jgi:hypothetical protein